MTGWTFESEGDAYVTDLDSAERGVLLDVVDQVLELLGGRPADVPTVGSWDVRLVAEPVDPPDDPALRRLLPDVSRDDAHMAAEFRRLTEQDLRTTKVAHLMRLQALLRDTHPEVVVVPSEAPAVAAALADLRLVLAERLGVRTEEDAEAMHRLVLSPGTPGSGDPREATQRFLATVHTMVGVLQESLVGLMLDALPDPPGTPAQA